VATIFYDYVLNLRREIDLTWRRGSTTGTILFLANRYLALAYCLFRLTSLIFHSLGRSVDHLLFHTFGNKDTVTVFSALRVYAVSSKNWTLTSLALGWGLVPLVTNIVSIVNQILLQFMCQWSSAG
ncbi:hypothetical protein POSPLADRAFT_1153892, partial [Postia placenta MAD-698-R-SB12]